MRFLWTSFHPLTERIIGFLDHESLRSLRTSGLSVAVDNTTDWFHPAPSEVIRTVTAVPIEDVPAVTTTGSVSPEPKKSRLAPS